MSLPAFQRGFINAVAITVVLSLAGCETLGPLQLPGGSNGTTAGPEAGLTAAEQQMRVDGDRFNQTVIGGVLTGAATGGVTLGLVTWMTGGDSRRIRENAVIGLLGGGVIGGIDGYVTAKKERAGNDQIRALQAAAEDVRRDNLKLQAFLDSSGEVLAEGKARLAALRGDIAAKKLTAEQAEQARKREEQNIEAMKTALTQARKTRDQYRQASERFAGTQRDKRDLDAEITRMDKQVTQLEGNITEYNKVLAVSRA